MKNSEGTYWVALEGGKKAHAVLARTGRGNYTGGSSFCGRAWQDEPGDGFMEGYELEPADLGLEPCVICQRAVERNSHTYEERFVSASTRLNDGDRQRLSNYAEVMSQELSPTEIDYLAYRLCLEARRKRRGESKGDADG